MKISLTKGLLYFAVTGLLVAFPGVRNITSADSGSYYYMPSGYNPACATVEPGSTYWQEYCNGYSTNNVTYPVQTQPTSYQNSSSINHNGICEVIEPSSQYYQEYCLGQTIQNQNNYNITYPQYTPQPASSSGIDHTGICNVIEPSSQYYQEYCLGQVQVNQNNYNNNYSYQYYRQRYHSNNACAVADPGSLYWMQYCQ